MTRYSTLKKGVALSFGSLSHFPDLWPVSRRVLTTPMVTSDDIKPTSIDTNDVIVVGVGTSMLDIAELLGKMERTHKKPILIIDDHDGMWGMSLEARETERMARRISHDLRERKKITDEMLLQMTFIKKPSIQLFDKSVLFKKCYFPPQLIRSLLNAHYFRKNRARSHL